MLAMWLHLYHMPLELLEDTFVVWLVARNSTNTDMWREESCQLAVILDVGIVRCGHVQRKDQGTVR